MEYIFFVSTNPSEERVEIETPSHKTLYLRVVEYRGGTESLKWGLARTRDDETLLNTFNPQEDIAA